MLLETLNSKELTVLPQIDDFETGQFELWFQPIYQLKTGAVLHNEVLLRWRDHQGQLHLPQEFLPSLSQAEALGQLDQTLIRKATELLARLPERCLSVNLSGEGLSDFALIEYIQTVLDQSGVEPERLSFELTEAAIAKDFPTVRAFTHELKSLGCGVILDNFASRELTLLQCQQLEADLVKVDGQLIQRLKTDPSSRVLTQAILEGVRALGQVAAKFVADAVTLDLVKEARLDYVQGHYLKAPSPEPDWADRVEPAEAIALPTFEAEQPPLSWRVIQGITFVLLGVAAVGVGVASISYRLGHVTVGDAVLNGRIVRVQAPADGSIEAFYAQPGVEVKSGQVLARIGIPPNPDEKQALLPFKRGEPAQANEQLRTQLETSQLQGQLQVKATQLASAQESLAALNNQLQNLEGQNQAVQEVNVTFASEAVREERAALEATIAKATAARSEYERYQQLVDEGAVSQLKTDQARAAWEAAQAEVERAQAVLRSTQASLAATESGVDVDGKSDLVSQRLRLLQTIQEQEGLVKTLEAQVATGIQQLQQLRQAQSPSKTRSIPTSKSDSLAPTEPLREQDSSASPQTPTPGRETLVQEVLAPFAGVIYRTEREQGEQVSRAEPMLTLLDCNDLWVETVVSVDVANRIDPDKPVTVHLANSSQTLTGEVDLIQPIDRTQGISNDTKLSQSQALLPAIPPKLEGQLLTLITVRIPPTPQHTKAQRFCGLGQATELTFSKKAWGSR